MQGKLQAYVGVRASLRSTSSGETRCGWVSELSPGRLTLRFEEKQTFEPNDAFVIELFGRAQTIAFAGIYSESVSSEFYLLYSAGVLFSETALDLDFVDVEHYFRIASDFRFRSTNVPFRIAVGDVSAQMEFVGQSVDVNVLNVGEETIGCYSLFELEIGSKYPLRIGTASGDMKFEGTVLECKAINKAGSHYRVVFNVVTAGRVHAARWRRFIDQQSLAA